MSNAAREGPMVTCPHGDPTCPCPDITPAACHYEGADAWFCPNPPDGWQNLTFAHCHMEGCSWAVGNCAQDRVDGECGLIKLGYPPVAEIDGVPYWSMAQARPGSVAWVCGWLRTPLNIGSKGNHP